MNDVSGTAKNASNRKFLQEIRDTRVDDQTIEVRPNAKDILRDVDEGPGSRTGQPAVFGFAMFRGIFTDILCARLQSPLEEPLLDYGNAIAKATGRRTSEGIIVLSGFF